MGTLPSLSGRIPVGFHGLIYQKALAFSDDLEGKDRIRAGAGSTELPAEGEDDGNQQTE